MSDSIAVRVALDESAILNPVTRVYVQIPEVARTEYLLPAERYQGLKNRAWPEVLDVAQEHAAQGWALASPAADARRRVAEWLRDPTNRDEMQATFEEDHARRDPVARKLTAEVERLQARVAELEAVPTVAYRADHPDSGITLGHYGTPAAARKHCEETERHSWPTGTSLVFDWIEDDEDRVAELVVTAGQNEESTTGYLVTELELPSEYDEGADE